MRLSRCLLHQRLTGNRPGLLDTAVFGCPPYRPTLRTSCSSCMSGCSHHRIAVQGSYRSNGAAYGTTAGCRCGCALLSLSFPSRPPVDEGRGTAWPVLVAAYGCERWHVMGTAARVQEGMAGEGHGNVNGGFAHVKL